MTDTPKIPPQSQAAERWLLGAMLVEWEALKIAFEDVRLTPKDFYRPQHQTICEGLLPFYRKREPVDVLALETWLKGMLDYEEMGGRMALLQMCDEGTRNGGAVLAKSWAVRIQRCAQQRAFIHLGQSLMDAAWQEEADIQTLGTSYADQLEQIRQGTLSQQALQRLRDHEKALFYRYEDEHSNEQAPGISTGIHSLDRMMQPMLPGDLVIFAARPSMGKTLLAQNIALRAAKAGKSVLFLSIEMSEDQLAQRAMLSDVVGVAGWELDKFTHRKSHWEDRIAPALGVVIEDHWGLDYAIEHPGRLTPQAVMEYGRRKRKDGGLDLLVIDYLQLMDTDERGMNDQQRVSMISRKMKQAAVELKTPIILLSQLSRACESREDKRPLLSDLRESGQIEQDADAVWMLYREAYYNDKANPNLCEVIFRKQRRGRIGTETVYMDLERADVRDLAKD